MDESSASKFTRDMRPIVAHLHDRDEIRYWRDFVAAMAVGYPCSCYYLMRPFGSWDTILAFIIAGLCIYRISILIHEIVHFRPGEMRWFETAWNLWAGIPLLIPSFFYESHRSHHNTHAYGTEDDSEYVPLVHEGWWGLIKFVSEIVLLPVFFVVRFLIGTPVSLLIPGTREWMLRRCSSFAINLKYEHEIRKDAPRKLWALIELACFSRIMILIIMIWAGAAPATRIPKIFALALFSITLNHLRTLTAHSYANHGHSMSHHDQVLDTTNITGGWLTELVCPLGSRYHAVHHLFPRIPYHNLAEAHKLLSSQLPADSPYHQLTYPSCRSVLSELVTNIRQHSKPEPPTSHPAVDHPNEPVVVLQDPSSVEPAVFDADLPAFSNSQESANA